MKDFEFALGKWGKRWKNREFNKVGFNEMDYKNLLDARAGDIITLEDAMVDISESALNVLFTRNQLPSLRMERFLPIDILGISLKYISKKELENESERLIQKRRRLYESAYNSILKELKSFNGIFPNESQLERILSRCGRKDSAFRDLSISVEEIRKRFNSLSQPQKFILPYEDFILMTILASKKAMHGQKKGECFPYIDGENMVLSMFEIAKQQQRGLVLQEFIRGTDYSIYRNLLPKYPNLNVSISSCRTWDTKKFPEFDYNLVSGLKYLQGK